MVFGVMKLDTTSKVLEIVTSVAVLISVIALVVEVRENTMALKRTSYDSALEGIIEWRSLRVEYPDLNKLVVDALHRGKYPEFDLEERQRFDTFMRILWLNYERAYWANEYEQMGSAEWKRMKDNTCSSIPPTAAGWDAMKSYLSDPFARFVEACPGFGKWDSSGA